MLTKLKSNSFLVLLALLFTALPVKNLLASDMPVLVGIGGSFTAVNSDSQTITEADLKGYPVLLAFGYTNCADICPITVGYMRKVYEQLKPTEQEKVRFVFVTVDPEYDTPEHLKAYLGHFNENFIGITGSREQLDQLVDNYKVDYKRLSADSVPTKYIRRIEEKSSLQPDAHAAHQGHAGMSMPMTEQEPEDRANLFTHSAHLFIIDKDMQTRSLAHTGTPTAELLADLRSLIADAK